MRPRVGHIQFLNCLPIYYGLVKGSGILDLELVRGLPTELNALLLEGRLDISPISSIEYARNPEELLLLPGPTVSCRGRVQSILLLSRLPLEKLDGRPVALTSSSATSHVLLRILLEKRYRVKPDYFLFDDDPVEALRHGEAALLIGDRALENLDAAAGLTVHDLGEEWGSLTGKGMVFALWAVRREFAEKQPGLVEHVWRLFQDSIDYSSAILGRIARDAARWERFSPQFLENYFRSLSFGLEEDLNDGLKEFYRMAAEIGELPGVPKVEFISRNSADPPLHTLAHHKRPESHVLAREEGSGE